MPPTEEPAKKGPRRKRFARERRRVRRAVTAAAPISLALTIILAPELMDGMYGWGICIITLLCAVACGSAAWAAHEDGLDEPLSGVWIVFLAALGFTVVQALPLPIALAGWLQPDAVGAARDVAALLGTPAPAWHALSLSPVATRAEIVKGTAILTAFAAAWLLVRLGHRERVLSAVGLSTVVMALVALSHVAADSRLVFGLYEAPSSPLPAPIINNNQLGGFLTLGAPVLLGLGLASEARRQRFAWMSGAVLTMAASMICLSRGAVASLFAGALAFGLLALMRKREPSGGRFAGALVTLAGTLVVGVGMGLYAGFGGIYHDFEHGDLSKLRLAGEGLELALTRPIFGVGRGAFSAAFVHLRGTEVRFTHPENFLAQWASEWGLPLTLALLGVLGVFFVRAALGARRWPQIGALAGVVAMGVHELFDFATERLGVAVVTAALIGAALAPSRRNESEERAPALRSHSVVRASFGLTAFAVAALGLIGWRIDLDRVEIQQENLVWLLTMHDEQNFRAALVDAAALHPAEPSILLLAGAEAARRNDPAAIGWLNRAMERAPYWASPHVEAAYLFVGDHRFDQAFLEMRQAEEREPGSATWLACWSAQHGGRVESLLRSARTSDPRGRRWLEGVAACLPVSSAQAIAVDEALLHYSSVPAQLRNARRALEDGSPDRALEILSRVGSQNDEHVRLLAAEAHMRAGRPRQAVRMLMGVEAWAHDPAAVLRVRAQAQATAGDADGMREDLERLRGRSAGNPTILGDSWVLQGDLERSMGNFGRAVQAYERASQLGSSEGTMRAARQAEELGDLTHAYHAYNELCHADSAGTASPSCAARDRIAGRIAESRHAEGQPLATP